MGKRQDFMKNYKCKICGKKHPVFHGAKSLIPAILRDIPDNKWGKRVLENDGFYLLDKKYLIIDGYIQVFHETDSL